MKRITAITTTSACVATLALTACSLPGPESVAEPATASQVSAATQCRSPAGTAAAIPSRDAAEPQMRIPHPPGWQRFTKMDSQFVRYVLVNPELTYDRFAPTVVVGLDVVAGQQPAKALFEANRAQLLEQGQAANLHYSAGTVCGHPAETVTYIGSPNGMPARPISDLAIVIDGAESTYFINVVIQSRDDANPTYQRDKQTILSGFQAQAPSMPATKSI